MWVKVWVKEWVKELLKVVRNTKDGQVEDGGPVFYFLLYVLLLFLSSLLL